MELWDVYNADRVLTGKTMVRGEPIQKGHCHLVVHACIFNKKGQMLIQQRQLSKRGWPGRWDITAGGSAIHGETSRMAIEREVFEELGLKLDFQGMRPQITFHFDADFDDADPMNDAGFDDVYLLEKEVDLTRLRLQAEEVRQVQWASLDEICRRIDQQTFIPYDKSILRMFFDTRCRYGMLAKK